MPFVDLLAVSRKRTPSRCFFEIVMLCSIGLLAGAPAVWAQASGSAGLPGIAPSGKPSAPAVAAKREGPTWQELSVTQRQVLLPLAGKWDSLSPSHKNKWIALAQNYAAKSTAEQQIMQSRMVEWAGLSPSDRERARLNFAESKKLSPSTRAAEWEAYQGLSAEDKQRLAAKGTGKPAGAAVAVTPVPPSKLIAVPITRHTPLGVGGTAASRPIINPKTLLPSPPVPAPSAPATAEAVSSAPTPAASVPGTPAVDTSAPVPPASAAN